MEIQDAETVQDLTWKPLLFLKRFASVEGRRRELREAVVEPAEINLHFSQIGDLYGADVRKLGGVQSHASNVRSWTYAFSPYVAAIAQTPQLSGSIRARISTDVYYCLYRWKSLRLKAKTSKGECLRRVFRTIHQDIDNPKLIVSHLNSRDFVEQWEFGGGGRNRDEARDEVLSLRAFRRQCDTLSEAWDRILYD